MPQYIISKNCIPLCKTERKTDSSCKDTVRFFGTLATKLMEMAETIHERIEQLKDKLCVKPSKGFLFAEIEAPKMVLGVKYEYIEYIRRFGPPVNGLFDEEKLESLRIELGINNVSTFQL